MCHMLWMMWLLGCSTTARDPATLYIQAAEDPVAPTACEGITPATLYGECVAMTASEVAAAMGEQAARARCARLMDGDPWRDECYFLISDTLEAAGEQAVSLCNETGQYRSRCVGHALQREGRALLDRFPRGEEAEAYKIIKQRSEYYFNDPKEGGRKVWHLMMEYIASRDYGEPFRIETCGSVPERLCVSAFVTRLRFAERDSGSTTSQLHTLCQSQPRTSETATSLGLMGWADDASHIAKKGLKRLCRS